MKTKCFVLWSAFAIVVLVLSTGSLIAGERTIPKPLPGHPGNVFLAGEEVAIAIPASTTAWRLFDYEGKTVAEGGTADGKAGLGKLPVGYYELRSMSNGVPGEARVALGVLSPLAAPVPKTSPIGVDVAMAWFYKGTQQEGAANLCALAGVNWVRDRLLWSAMEPAPEQFVASAQYDETARKQSEAGLQILQVIHLSPDWANPNTMRFPIDLRASYDFMRYLAQRWKGHVTAFEPWNEADIKEFGGHSGSEIAALQKASYLGLKAGNPEIIACQNVFALPNRGILEDLNANEAWPYFDTFNLHHYVMPDGYPGVYQAFRDVSAGKPLWVTEFSAPVHWSGDPKEEEVTDADLRLQAQRVPQVFASALFEGPKVAFYFMLPHYCEGPTQFGILHRDLSPRPAYIALAAVGRLLSDAKPLGKLRSTNDVRAFLFRARPDGRERDVLVAWASTGQTIQLPTVPSAVIDHLGRTNTCSSTNLALSAAPVYAVFEPGKFHADLVLPPVAPALRTDKPSPVVLQLLMPPDQLNLNLSAYRSSSEHAVTYSICAYNFGSDKVSGILKPIAPPGWVAYLPERIDLRPGERKDLPLTLNCQGGASSLIETIHVRGDFGSAGKTTLSFRLMPEPLKIREGATLPISSASGRWTPLISGGGEVSLTNSDAGLTVKCKLTGGDRWVYPVTELRPEERPQPGFNYLIATISVCEGKGNFRAIFDEENGSSYVAEFTPEPKVGQTNDVVAALDTAAFGTGWSPLDDNGKLDRDKIKRLKIGCNTTGDSLTYTVKNLRWVKAKP